MNAHVVRRGQGLPVVAIHGNGVDHRLLLPLDPVLAQVGGLERVYLDLPGFGQSPALQGVASLQGLADWLVDCVRDLVGDRPFALMGNSLGGLLARHVRANLPDQAVGLALIAPVVRPEASRRTVPQFRVVERDDAFLDSLPQSDREHFTEMSARQSPRTWELFREFALPAIQAADQDYMNRLGQRYFLARDPDESEPRFIGPALIVTGRQDHVVGFEDQFHMMQRHYRGATYAVIEGAGHNVHLDAPGPVAALLSQWGGDVGRFVANG